jgi:hypothetical protein
MKYKIRVSSLFKRIPSSQFLILTLKKNGVVDAVKEKMREVFLNMNTSQELQAIALGLVVHELQSALRRIVKVMVKIQGKKKV